MTESNALAELKPCPFCGSEAQVREWDWPYTRFQVRCSYCRAMPGNRKSDKSRAIAAWNTRATESAAEPVQVMDGEQKRFMPGCFHCRGQDLAYERGIAQGRAEAEALISALRSNTDGK